MWRGNSGKNAISSAPSSPTTGNNVRMWSTTSAAVQAGAASPPTVTRGADLRSPAREHVPPELMAPVQPIRLPLHAPRLVHRRSGCWPFRVLDCRRLARSAFLAALRDPGGVVAAGNCADQ